MSQLLFWCVSGATYNEKQARGTHLALSAFTEAVSEITGGPDMYAQEGSDVTLMCRLRNYTEPPTYVFWYHGDQMINYDADRKVSLTGIRLRGNPIQQRISYSAGKTRDCGREVFII